MAQIIKHRRGGLESVKDATKRAGELLVITGSTGISADNGNGLLFVGIDGSTVTPANKILTGSTTPTLTGGSYDTSVDGLPFYNTSQNKLYILQNTGANIEVQATANTNGTGIVSSSAQVDSLGFLKVNSDSVISSSAQLTTEFDTRYLNTNGDSVISSSAQLTSTFDSRYLNTNGDGVVSGSVLRPNGDSVVSSSAQISVTNSNVAGGAAIDHSKIDFGGSNITSGSLNLTVGADNGSDDIVQVGVNTLTLAGTANEIETTVTDNQVAIGIVTNPTLTGNVIVTGDLSVQGTTTTVDSTTVNIGDNIIALNFGGSAQYAGIQVGDATSPGTESGSLVYNGATNRWMAGQSGSEVNVLLANSDGVISSSAQLTSTFDTRYLNTDGDGVVSGSVLRPNGDGVVSGSGQIRANQTENFNTDVKARLTAEGVISSSAQIDGDFLNTNGDSVISSSAQLTTEFDTRYLNTNGDGVISGSGQLTSTFDSRYLNTNGDSVVSGSEQISVTNSIVASDAAIASSKINYNSTGIVSQSAQVTGIVNSQVDAGAAIDHSKIDFGGSNITSGSLNLTISGSTGNDTVGVGTDALTFAGTANEIETTVTDNQVAIGIVTNPTLTGNVTVTGNLSVEGVTTTIDSTTVNIGDRILELNYGGASGDAGILVSDAVGGNTTSGSLLWDASEDHWMAGALGSEKEIALLNAAPTSNTVLKANASGLLVDSLITDDGTNVTISGTAELRVNSATANSFAFFNGDKSLESVAGGSAGNLIQYNGSSFVSSNEIDGGTF